MANNHNQNLYVWDMVTNRLPFLDKASATNEQLVSDFTLEVMHELEPCLQIEEAGGTIGVEDDYNIAQRSFIADVVTCYILMVKAAAVTAGNSGSNNIGDGTPVAPADKVITEVKAGSVGVKWSQFDITKNAGLATNTNTMLSIYKKSAARRALKLGCIFDICDGCITLEMVQDSYEIPPFQTYTFDC